MTTNLHSEDRVEYPYGASCFDPIGEVLYSIQTPNDWLSVLENNSTL